MTDEMRHMIRLYEMRNTAVSKHRKPDHEALDWAISFMEVKTKINCGDHNGHYAEPLPGITHNDFLQQYCMENFWDCPHCPSYDSCFMKNKGQRIPRECGGLGLCPNLRSQKG